jgi:hypothetical protein
MSLLDADRLAKLAGLPVSDRKSLNEGGNRSYHEDVDPEKIAEFRYGKNQLAEKTQKDDDKEDEAESGRHGKRGDVSRKGRRDDTRGKWGKRGEERKTEGGASIKGDPEAMKEEDSWMTQMEGNEVVEIDDRMLVAEIARMRKERLQENELRSVIRTEIGSILRDLKSQKRSRAPRDASRPSQGRGITMGIPGPGFR